MDFGIVIVVVVLAAILAPLFWAVWWAVDSLGSPRVAIPAAVGPTPKPPARRIDYPVAVDSRLPGRPDAITVYTASAQAPKSFCAGPDAAGRCPIALSDGTVPCAGCVLVLPQPVRGSRDWQIPRDFQTCLVGSYSLYRQAAR